VGGVVILWLDVVVSGWSAHAEAADRAVNPVDLSLRIVERLRRLEREMNTQIEPAMDGVAHPYNVNIGTFRSGDWPSSVPAAATLRIRVGHPTAWSAEEAEARVRAAILSAGEEEPWLRDHPPAVHPSGFKARGYALAADDPLAERVGFFRTRPRTGAASREGQHDRRAIYLNAPRCPPCYGPIAHDIHGIDESVEPPVVAGPGPWLRFIGTWYADPPEDR
jgi:acetylornithine deacetylase